MINQLYICLIILILFVVQIPAQKSLYPVHSPDNGKWGYYDEKARIAIPFIFEDASEFTEGLAAVKKNEKYGYIDSIGILVIPCIYDYVYPFSEGLAKISQNEKFGFINARGEMIINPEFDYAGSFKNSIAQAYKNKSYFFIDRTGQKVITTNFDLDFCDGLAVLEKYGKYGYINNTGKFIIQPVYLKAFPFNNGKALVKIDGKYYAFINTKGEIIFKTEFIPSSKFSEGLTSYVFEDKTGFIDTLGKIIIKDNYSNDYIDPEFHDGLCILSDLDKTIIINKTGRTVKAFEREVYISDFHQNFAIVSKWGGQSAYINNNGEFITEFKYEKAWDFSEGLAIAVNLDKEFEIINTNGEIVAKIENACSDVGTKFKFKNGVCTLELNVLADSTMLLPPNTENAEFIKQWGGVQNICVDRKGKILWKGAPWYSCFLPDALVSMANGSLKKIKDISPGDSVLSYNAPKDAIYKSIVVECQCFIGKSCITGITFSSKNELSSSINLFPHKSNVFEATPMHPILTEKGIKKIKDLCLKDTLYFKDLNDNYLEKVPIEDIHHNILQVNKVYHLKTTSGNYLVNGIVVFVK